MKMKDVLKDSQLRREIDDICKKVILRIKENRTYDEYDDFDEFFGLNAIT